jgi:hypothetical protein
MVTKSQNSLISRIADALDRLVKIDAKLVVPGHGEPMPPSGLETYRKAFRQLLACAKSKRESQEC